ncbi:MAG: septation protein SpoVG family protein [Bdellovibrionales bacterium]|nr:septation protein SpoVG family protein [Bdellovibrionales bacterium]
MKITNVKITLKTNEAPLKAFASITFEKCFVVHDLRIINTKDKTFVAMPSKKVKDVNRISPPIHKDIAHPINKEMRQLIEDEVLKEYQKTLEDYKI